MNRQVTHLLQLGVFFTAAVIILDLLLVQIPVLDWFALAVAFMLAATLILDSMLRLVPREKRRPTSNQQIEDEFQYLTHIVDKAINDHDEMSARILSEELRSLVLGTIAARMRLSRKEVLEQVENDPESIRRTVRDEEIMKLLIGNISVTELMDERQFEKILATIEG